MNKVFADHFVFAFGGDIF